MIINIDNEDEFYISEDIISEAKLLFAGGNMKLQA